MERHLTLPLPGDEAGVPEVRVAVGTSTSLRFDAPIERASLEVEGRKERFHLVDVGEHFIVLEPSLAPGPGERLGLKVRYRGGSSPAQATFSLVSHDTEVDGEVKVARHPRTPESLEAELAEKDAKLAALQARCGESGPAGLVFSGRLDLDGVWARTFEVHSGTQQGLKAAGGIGYRAGRWAMAVVRVRNLPGQPPWSPVQARLLRADGTPVKVLHVGMDREQLTPGEEGVVAVETEAPFWEASDTFSLEVVDLSGTRRLLIPAVLL